MSKIPTKKFPLENTVRENWYSCVRHVCRRRALLSLHKGNYDEVICRGKFYSLSSSILIQDEDKSILLRDFKYEIQYKPVSPSAKMERLETSWHSRCCNAVGECLHYKLPCRKVPHPVQALTLTLPFFPTDPGRRRELRVRFANPPLAENNEQRERETRVART